MDNLLTPDFGLIIWQAIVFLVVLLILGKFAWKPIMGSIKERELSIEESLASAQRAKAEMQQLHAENEKLLDEARLERDRILKDAIDAGNRMKEEAKAETSKISEKMIEDAKLAIQTEKRAALADVKSQVAMLSLQIAEKLLREQLSTEAAQKKLVEGYVKELN